MAQDTRVRVELAARGQDHEVAPALASTCTVLTVDLPGHGFSQATDASPMAAIAPVLFLVVYGFTRRIKKASRAVRKKESELVSMVAEAFPEAWIAIVPEHELRTRAQAIAAQVAAEDAAKMKSVPIWAFHGADDTTVPVAGSQRMTRPSSTS